MRRGAVIALAVVLHGQFPVRRDRVILAVRHLRIRQVIGREAFGQAVAGRLERRRLVGEVHEDQAAQQFHVHALQADAALVEVLVHARGADQPPLEVVGPAVVGADQPLRAAGLRHADARTSVPADVEHRVDRAVGAARDDHGFAGKIEQEPVARVRNLALMPGVQPRSEKDAFHVPLVDVGIGVELARQRMPLALPVDQLVQVLVVHLRCPLANSRFSSVGADSSAIGRLISRMNSLPQHRFRSIPCGSGFIRDRAVHFANEFAPTAPVPIDSLWERIHPRSGDSFRE